MALIRRASDIGERLIDVVACRVAAAVATAIDEKLAEMNESYSDASARIAQAIKKLTEDPSWAKSPWSAMDKPIHEKDSQILDRLHARNAGKCLMNVVQSPTFIDTDSLVSELTKDAGIVIREFIGKLPSGTDFKPIADSDSQLQEIRGTVAFDHAYSSSDSTDLVASGITAYLGGQGDSVTMTETHTWSAPNELPALTVESAIEAVRPPLLECGGRQRLYLICRDKLEQQKLLSQFPDAVKNSLTTIFARSSMPMLVHEAQGIELKNILSWLDSLTGDDGRISSRLATRCDVDWK